MKKKPIYCLFNFRLTERRGRGDPQASTRVARKPIWKSAGSKEIVGKKTGQYNCVAMRVGTEAAVNSSLRINLESRFREAEKKGK